MGRSKQREINDVSIWFETGDADDAGTDSDVFVKFFDSNDTLIGWLEVYERSDLNAFESGMLNYGDIGNLLDKPWLMQLKQDVAKLSIDIINITNDDPGWYPQKIALDFCQDMDNELSLIYLWQPAEWITEGEQRLFTLQERFEGDVRKSFSQRSWRTVDILAGAARESP